MGILDQFFSDDPRSVAEMAIMTGLLTGKGNFSSVAGNALMGGMNAYSQAKEAGQKNQLTKMQIEEMARRMKQQEQAAADQQAFKQAIPAPTALGGVDWTGAQKGPTPDRVQQVQPLDPNAVLQYQAMKFNQLSPLDYMKLQQKEKPQLQTFKPGEIGGYVQGGKFQEVFRAPDKADKGTSDMQEYAFAIANGDIRAGTSFTDWMRGNKRAGASNVSVNTDNLGLKPKDRFEMEGKLADDYRAVTKLDNLVLSASSKIKTALSQSGAVKDQAAIYSFAKLLDPDGAVREADYAAITNTAGLVDRAKNYLNRLLTGEQLNPTQRKEMLDLMVGFERVANERITNAKGEFSGQAKRYNLSPDAVTAGTSKSEAKVRKYNPATGKIE